MGDEVSKRPHNIGDDVSHHRFVLTRMRLHNLCIDLGNSKVSREWRGEGDDDIVDSDGEELEEDDAMTPTMRGPGHPNDRQGDLAC